MKYRPKKTWEERKALFIRDGFTCQFCGRAFPEVLLDIDRQLPCSREGDEGCFVTSCYECTRRQWRSHPGCLKPEEQSHEMNMALMAEEERQHKAWAAWKTDILNVDGTDDPEAAGELKENPAPEETPADIPDDIAPDFPEFEPEPEPEPEIAPACEPAIEPETGPAVLKVTEPEPEHEHETLSPPRMETRGPDGIMNANTVAVETSPRPPAVETQNTENGPPGNTRKRTEPPVDLSSFWFKSWLLHALNQTTGTVETPLDEAIEMTARAMEDAGVLPEGESASYLAPLAEAAQGLKQQKYAVLKESANSIALTDAGVRVSNMVVPPGLNSRDRE